MLRLTQSVRLIGLRGLPTQHDTTGISSKLSVAMSSAESERATQAMRVGRYEMRWDEMDGLDDGVCKWRLR
jgi:hypothetical protein